MFPVKISPDYAEQRTNIFLREFPKDGIDASTYMAS